MRTKRTISIFCLILSILSVMMVFAVGCGEEQQVVCYIDIINPETGESLKREYALGYKDAYFTYDGKQKQLEFAIRRKDNNKQIYADSFKIYITYENPYTGELEYNQPYMDKKGTYYWIITDFNYDKEKYFIPNREEVKVHIE